MTDQEFNDLVEARLAKIKDQLALKGEEYARGDRLSNFKKAAAALGCAPERALAGFWMKHIVSILDMINDLEAGRRAPHAVWDEKIGDAINYLVLLEALRHE
jgi:hypothetical protein